MSPEADKQLTDHATGAPPPRRRPWYRLHLSTWVVLLFVAAALFIIILPGANVTGWQTPLAAAPGPSGILPETWVKQQEHGWPFIYLERAFAEDPDRIDVSELDAIIARLPIASPRHETLRWATGPKWDNDLNEWQDPRWLKASNWPFAGREYLWYKTGLALDVLAALLICGCVAGFHEWWRRSRRRFWQFALRDLLIFVALAAAVMGWYRWTVVQRDREAEVTAALEREGCFVSRRCCAPLAMRRLVGFKRLGWLYRVHGFVVQPDPGGGNAGARMARIGSLAESLRYLEVVRIEAGGDAALGALEGLATLRQLEIEDASVTDEGIRSLQTLRELEELLLSGLDAPMVLTDRGLAHVSEIKTLRVLTISSPAITDEGLAALAALPELEHLHIAGCDQLTDEGLVHLSALPKLEVLGVGGCKQITDRGIVHLKKLTGLRQLWLWGPGITKAGADELRRALPHTYVHFQ